MLLTEKEAKGLCDKLLSYVKADDAQVSVSGENYSHLRFGANSFTTSGRRENTSASVTVWINKRQGSASINEVDDASLRTIVEEAERVAKISPVDREYMPTLGRQSYKPTGGYVEATSNINLMQRAKSVSNIIARCEKNNVVAAGFHQARGVASASATKNGNFLFNRSSLVSLGMTSRTRVGDGSGYFLRNHFDVRKFDTDRVASESIDKALRSRQPRTLAPGAYTVVLEPQAVADLIGNFQFAFNARNADEGRSAFSAPGGKTKLGMKIFDERINLYSDPWHPELPGAPGAQSGIPAQKLYLVKDGVVENLIYSRFWAKEKGKEPTPGPVNGILESTTAPVSIEDMIKSTKRGLLIGRFWYIRSVDPRTALITGLTRDGVWLVEDGKIQYPVRNFRFNQSILKMLEPGNVELIGSSERVGSSEAQGNAASLLPPLKIREFNFTSQSEAV